MKGGLLRVALSSLLLLGIGFPPARSRTTAECGAKRRAAASESRHVIMISIDGLLPEYYTARRRLGLRVPNLEMMKRRGSFAEGVEGTFPSVTYPSHTTMVTGVRPVRHGIEQNRVFDPPDRAQTKAWNWFAKDIKSETLWTLAKRAGLLVGAVSWPATVGAEIDQNVPEIWYPGEDPLTWKRVLENCTPGLKPVIGESAGDEEVRDDRRTEISEFIIKTYRPHLMLIHFIGLDRAQHDHGPRSQPAFEAVEREDQYLGRILESARTAGIYDRTTFVVVSDHGFAPVQKKYRPNVELVREGLIRLGRDGRPTAWKAVAWPSSGSCAIVLNDSSDKAAAAKVTAIFTALASQPDSPIRKVISRAELDRLGAYPSAALALEAAPGYSFDGEFEGPAVRGSGDYRGTHGQLPSRPEMYASLIIFGWGARTGAKVRLARMIDIAPTVAVLLGLRFEKADGSPISYLLKMPAAHRASFAH